MDRARHPFLTTLPGVVTALLVYGLAHGTMRLAASWNLGENDPLSLLYTQTVWAWFSSFSVFDLLVMGLSELFGPTALVFQILRYGLLAIALTLIFLIARRISGSGFWAALTVESYALIYQISWRFHEGFTHPLVTIIAVAATFWAFLDFQDGKRRFLLPFPLVFGLMTGFWFLAFLASLLGALFLLRQGSIAVRVWLFLPFMMMALFWWFSPMPFWTNSLLPEIVSFAGIASGGGPAALKVIAYLSPFLPLVVLIFGLPLIRKIRPQAPDTIVGVIAVATIVGAGGVVLVGLIMGQAPYGEHALMPLFFLTPIWIMDAVRRSSPTVGRIKIFTAICFALMIVAFLARAANLYVLDPVCKKCYFGIPYQGLAEQLSDEFSDHNYGFVISDDPRLAGHLTSYWPAKGTRFVSDTMNSCLLTNRFSGPVTCRSAGFQGAVLLVWNVSGGEARMRSLVESASLKPDEIDDVFSKARTIEVPWRHLWRETGYRKSHWKAVYLSRKDENVKIN